MSPSFSKLRSKAVPPRKGAKKPSTISTSQATTGTRSAAEKVIGIIELAEMILLHLPPKQILVLQRVSRTFKSSICSSEYLQRALGFTASQPLGWLPVSRPARFLPDCIARKFIRKLRFSDIEPMFNPLLEALCPHMEVCIENDQFYNVEKWWAWLSETLGDWDCTEINKSLRDAFVTQPPLDKLKIFIAIVELDEDGYAIAEGFHINIIPYDIGATVGEDAVVHTGFIENENGVKITDVIEYLDRLSIHRPLGFASYFALCATRLYDDTDSQMTNFE